MKDKPINDKFDSIITALEAIHEDVKVLLKEEAASIIEGLPELKEFPDPPANKCQLCGHQKEDHLPLTAKGCFSEGCKCKGWKFT